MAKNSMSLDNREAFEVSLVENVPRHTLDPIEEAHAFKKYVTDIGWEGILQLSRRLSKSCICLQTNEVIGIAQECLRIDLYV